MFSLYEFMGAVDIFYVKEVMASEGNPREANLQDLLKNTVDGTVDEATKNALKRLGDHGYFCDICKTSCKYDEDKIKQHNEGNKHKKNMAAKLKLQELNQKYDCFNQDPKNGTLQCTICNLQVTSPLLLEGHFNGKLHKKMAMDAHENNKLYSDIEKATAPVEVLATGTTSEVGKTDAVMTAAAGSTEVMAGVAEAAARITSNKSAPVVPNEDSSQDYWCKICKIKGNVPPAIKDAHMEGAKHKKKEAGFHLLQKLKQQEECIEEDLQSGLLKCTICGITISTGQQLAAHLSGAKHKNQAKSVAVTPETADLEEGEVPPEVFWCEVCKLSGPTTASDVTQHMHGSKHLKKVAQMQLLEKLLITEDCFYYNETTGLFKCNVCNIEQNTPQLLETHLESDKHKARMDGRYVDEKPYKRKYIDYDDPYRTEAKQITLNPMKRKKFNGMVNGLAYNLEERSNHFKSKDLLNKNQTINQDKIINLSAPHGEIKDLGKLMNKWAFAYYRNSS